MSIFRAKNDDIPRLSELVNRAYAGDTGSWTHEAHLVAGPRTHPADIARLFGLPGAVFLVYVDDGKLLGCVYLELREKAVYLGMLSVWPGHQGAGIGKALIGAAKDLAREHERCRIEITVVSERRELVTWYERQGFVQTGETRPFPEQLSVQKRPLRLLVLEAKI